MTISEGVGYNPKISIVLPVYNTPGKLLKACIKSVIDQQYENWELCIADDASPNKKVRDILKNFSSNDDRIKVVYLQDNKRISGATNAALNLATGEFITFLDHDDELLSNTLMEIVKCINKNPNVDFIYTDEAKILEDGTLVAPTYKPDYSPDYLMSNNYICHFSVYRKSLMEEIGILRDKCNGSQDYDLVLRMMEKAKNIKHIPQVLYFWRMIEGSVASNQEAKMYAYTAAQTALKDSLIRKNLKGTVSMPTLGWYHVKYEIKGKPLISIIIVDDGQELNYYKDLLYSLMSNTYKNIEILFVIKEKQFQNKKNELENLHLEEPIDIRLLKSKKQLSVSQLKNFAANQANGEYLFFVNRFVKEISPNSIGELLSYSQMSHVGLAGGEIFIENQLLQYGGLVILDFIDNNFQSIYGDIAAFSEIDSGYQLVHLSRVVRNCSSATGLFIIEKRKFFEAGCFDENLDSYFDEVDLGLKLVESGYFNVWNPNASSLISRDILDKKHKFDSKEYFKKKWSKTIHTGDKFYRISNMKKIKLYKDLAPNQNIAIFGATLDGEKCKQYVNKYQANVVCFIDNAKSKQNKLLSGIPVLSAEEVVSRKQDILDAIVLVSAGHKKAMKEQLIELGFRGKVLEY